MLLSCLAYSSTPQMKVMCFFEMLVDFPWITGRYKAEDSTLLAKIVSNQANSQIQVQSITTIPTSSVEWLSKSL
jgi:hypothetical protein